MSDHLCLAPHVRACAHGGQVILLDLRKGRYLGVAGTRFAPLGSAVSGWPRPDHIPPGAPTPTSGELDALAAPLLRQGLLTRSPSPLHAQANAALPEAARTLNAEELVGTAPVDAACLVRFVRCSAAAGLRLRLLPLQHIAHRITMRRTQTASTTQVPASHDRLRIAVAAYLHLRSLLLTAHDRCLHDSLSLLGFLAAEGWRPHWVIGVTTQPFRAHAWVQAGDLVLSDLHENVRRYTPILVA